MVNDSKILIYELLRDSYNSANFNEFCQILEKDVKYESQWVMEPLVGLDKVSQYLIGKSKTFQEKNAVIHAKVGILDKQDEYRPGVNLSYKPGEYCVVVEQGSNKMVIIMDITGNSVKRIDLCMPELFKYDLVEYPDHMTIEEIHDFGIEIVANQIHKEGYKVIELNREYGYYPQIIASKDGATNFIVVQTEIAPFFGRLGKTIAMRLKDVASKNRAIASFAPVSIGSSNSEDFKKSRAIRGTGFYANYQGLTVIK